MSVLDFLRRYQSYRLVRPWALSAPILVLLISVPLLRPLRSPDPRMMSDDERSRLATVQAIVEGKTLAIEGTSFRDTRDRIAGIPAAGERYSPHLYSNQLPMQAFLLSGPYWVMHHFGITLDRDPSWVVFWLTLLGVTLPVALSAGLIYRMGRQFELRRPLRAALGLIVVLGSGLISYSTVLNAHAPAAALLLSAAACLFHASTHKSPNRAIGWVGLAGVCAALAATVDLPAGVFLVLFIAVIVAIRWPVGNRLAGLALYVIGASIPIFVHARLNVPVTGDMLPGVLHPELAQAPQTNLFVVSVLRAPKPPAPRTLLAASPHPRVSAPLSSYDDDEDENLTRWQSAAHGALRVVGAFFGGHGIFSHFPVVFFGILGVSMIMHRHWPAATKTLAAATLGGALIVIICCAVYRPDSGSAMFATRWFVVFLPLTLFWAGAWLRRSHRQASWTIAGVLLAFSVVVALIGATGPLPHDGFDHYSFAGAWHNMLHPPQPPALPPLIAQGD